MIGFIYVKRKKRCPEGHLEFVYPSYDLLVVRGVQEAGWAALVVATELVVVSTRLVLQISVVGLASAAISCAELASVGVQACHGACVYRVLVRALPDGEVTCSS